MRPCERNATRERRGKKELFKAAERPDIDQTSSYLKSQRERERGANEGENEVGETEEKR